MSLLSSSRPALLRIRLAQVAVLAVVLAAVAALPAYAQILEGGVVKAQHDDWQVVCRPPPPGAKNEICGAV